MSELSVILPKIKLFTMSAIYVFTCSIFEECGTFHFCLIFKEINIPKPNQGR